MKGMDKIMLDCDHATYLITKSEYESLNCIQKIQLKLHLSSCKFCKMFAEQNKFISQSLSDFKKVDMDHLQLRLNDKQKSNLKEVVEANLDNNK